MSEGVGIVACGVPLRSTQQCYPFISNRRDNLHFVKTWGEIIHIQGRDGIYFVEEWSAVLIRRNALRISEFPNHDMHRGREASATASLYGSFERAKSIE